MYRGLKTSGWVPETVQESQHASDKPFCGAMLPFVYFPASSLNHNLAKLLPQENCHQEHGKAGKVGTRSQNKSTDWSTKWNNRRIQNLVMRVT